jgi:hypothetical protein
MQLARARPTVVLVNKYPPLDTSGGKGCRTHFGEVEEVG